MNPISRWIVKFDLSRFFLNLSPEVLLAEIKRAFALSVPVLPSEDEDPSFGTALFPILDLVTDACLSGAEQVRQGIRLFESLNPEVTEVPDELIEVYNPETRMFERTPAVKYGVEYSNAALTEVRKSPNPAVTSESTAQALEFLAEVCVVIKNCRGEIPRSLNAALLESRRSVLDLAQKLRARNSNERRNRRSHRNRNRRFNNSTQG
jgi:hypothetical protein